jgi:acyl carrier protein phosphodiesterase
LVIPVCAYYVPSTKEAQNKHRLAQRRHISLILCLFWLCLVAQNWHKSGTTIYALLNGEHKIGTTIAQKGTK